MTLKVESLVAISTTLSSKAVKVAGKVLLELKRWGVAKVRGAMIYSIITSFPSPSMISVRSFPSNNTYSLLQGVPCVTTISFLSAA